MDDLGRSRRLVWQWLVGILGSWACVWLTGPSFVNSILIRVNDPELNAITLREGDLIRWRSEGWASTRVGPHGRPGWQPNHASMRVVIWGDSQVEGFCVNDPQKISNQVIRLAQENHAWLIDCVPMGRSGSDASDWNQTLPKADAIWSPIAHVWIVTEFADLTALVVGEKAAVGRWQAESPAAVLLAKDFHAEAAFQAARNLVFDPTSGGIRSLRWSVGPVRASSQVAPQLIASDVVEIIPMLGEQLRVISQQMDQRLMVVYAPPVPQNMGGVLTSHSDDAAWEALAALLANSSIDTVDMRSPFIERYSVDGKMPRGFHNGTPGYGHLNAVGNQLIAMAIVERLIQRAQP